VEKLQDGVTVLMHAAVATHDIPGRVVTLLLERGADVAPVNVRHSAGHFLDDLLCTPL
jgi:ankyrin repeat protein